MHAPRSWSPPKTTAEGRLAPFADLGRAIAEAERLAGCPLEHALTDPATGEVRTTFDSKDQPDNTLLIACGDRCEARCPSCAARYRGNSFQIVASGLRGSKGVPQSVKDRPSLFVTLTARPSAQTTLNARTS